MCFYGYLLQPAAETDHLFEHKLITLQLLSKFGSFVLLSESKLIINEISSHKCPQNICSLMELGWSRSLDGLFVVTYINPWPLLKSHNFNQSTPSPKKLTDFFFGKINEII